MPQTIALLIHADPSVVPAYQSALGIPVFTTGSLGAGSSAYDERSGLARQPLSAIVARFCPGVPEGSRVVLIAWSAGCWAARAWLRDLDTRGRVPAAVLLDGLHVTSASPLGNEVDACREAMAGQRCVIVTHTQITPPTYRGTTESAELLLQQLRLVRVRKTDDLNTGDFHMRAYHGSDAAAHIRQLKIEGPELCRDIVRPYLLEHGLVDDWTADTDPAPAPELHGIDVSHHNRPDWSAIGRTSHFVWCRATYGTMRDRLVASHVSGARQAGLRVGLYHFYRPSQDAGDQADAFLSVCDGVGIGYGDLAHALDVEADTSPTLQPVRSDWEPGVRLLADRLSQDAGRPCVIYTTQREWRMLGNPGWLADHPLWIAHWIGVKEPAVPPGTHWSIHQFRVGLYDPWADQPKDGPSTPGALDHDRARQPLPIMHAAPEASVPRPRHTVPLIPIASDFNSRAAARDDTIRQQHDEGRFE